MQSYSVYRFSLRKGRYKLVDDRREYRPNCSTTFSDKFTRQQDIFTLPVEREFQGSHVPFREIILWDLEIKYPRSCGLQELTVIGYCIQPESTKQDTSRLAKTHTLRVSAGKLQNFVRVSNSFPNLRVTFFSRNLIPFAILLFIVTL